MNKIYFVIVICFIGACSTSDRGEKKIDSHEFIISDIDAVKIPKVEQNIKNPSSETFHLPILGQFDLAIVEIDSTNKYGAGDCWGNIKRYTLPNIGLAIDSMTCGEYGYTYTYYLLSPSNFIQVVYTKKSESLISLKNTSYYYVLKEQIIDFNSYPVISMTRIDTVYNYQNKVINKPFTKDTLKDAQASYEHWEMGYNGIWEMELDY